MIILNQQYKLANTWEHKVPTDSPFNCISNLSWLKPKRAFYTKRKRKRQYIWDAACTGIRIDLDVLFLESTEQHLIKEISLGSTEFREFTALQIHKSTRDKNLSDL